MITLNTVKGLLDILRGEEPVGTSWQALLRFFAKSYPDGLWEALPEPDLQQDVVAASAWIARDCVTSAFRPTNGALLGVRHAKHGQRPP